MGGRVGENRSSSSSSSPLLLACFTNESPLLLLLLLLPLPSLLFSSPSSLSLTHTQKTTHTRKGVGGSSHPHTQKGGWVEDSHPPPCPPPPPPNTTSTRPRPVPPPSSSSSHLPPTHSPLSPPPHPIPSLLRAPGGLICWIGCPLLTQQQLARRLKPGFCLCFGDPLPQHRKREATRRVRLWVDG